ncbi:MAG TPA: response regulator transcription factor [Bryobacteraceae bacterium]|jgi:DNA-binding response OmpR family regulator
MRVLVAEDKPRLANLLKRALMREGFEVALAMDGEQALAMSMMGGLDVLVLDVMLPGRDGFDVIRNLRAARQMTPAIMVTARDAMADVVRGLDLGADDYLTKPFSLEILLARVRALSRRGPITAPADLRFRDLVLHRRTHELQRGDRRVPLTRTEFELVETLMRRSGNIVPRDVLAEAGWGGDADVSDSTIYVFMRSLRSKITQPGEEQLLHTVRGVGYSLRTEES